MKIHILSDLHIEFQPFKLPAVDADVVVLAGDIHLAEKGFRWALAAISDRPVVYVLGNHEFYQAATPRLVHKLREKAAGTNIHVLEREAVAIDGVRFLGCTLWTDFKLLGNRGACMAAAGQDMNDYVRIRLSPEYRKIGPPFTAAWHIAAKKWIAEEAAAQAGTPVVVVTHHAPSIRSFRADDRRGLLQAAYASDLEAFADSLPISLWAHGHIHTASDYRIGDTRVVCNPRGYPCGRDNGFDAGLVVEI